MKFSNTTYCTSKTIFFNFLKYFILIIFIVPFLNACDKKTDDIGNFVEEILWNDNNIYDFTINEHVSDINTTNPIVANIKTGAKVETNNITYSVQDGDYDYFNVTGGSDGMVLTFKEAPIYETKHSYNFTVVAADAHNAITHPVTIDIKSIQLLWKSDNIYEFSINEHETSINTTPIQAITTIGSIIDTSSNITYSIKNQDYDSFNISSGKTGVVITLKDPAEYKRKNIYHFTIVAADANNIAEHEVTVNINKPDLAWKSDNVYEFSVNEHETTVNPTVPIKAITMVGGVVDTSSNITYSINNDQDSDIFNINSSTTGAVITFKSSAVYTKEKHIYNITIIAADANNTIEHTVTININEPDLVWKDNNVYEFFVNEHATNVNPTVPIKAMTMVGGAVDTSSNITYSINNDQDPDIFNVSSSTTGAVITFKSSAVYTEEKHTYNFNIVATDAHHTIEHTITVNINKPDLVWKDNNVYEFSVKEHDANVNLNSPIKAMTMVGGVVDTSSNITYSIKNVDYDSFNISTSDVGVVLTFKEEPVYTEEKHTYNFTIVATDIHNTIEHAVIIHVQQLQLIWDADTVHAFSVNEYDTDVNTNSPIKAVTMIGDTIDTNSNITYSIKDTDYDSFNMSISDAGVVLTFKEEPVYTEEKHTYNFNIIATDAYHTITHPVTVDIIPSGPLVMVFETDDNNQITIPTGSERYKFTAYWDDGTKDVDLNGRSPGLTHTYTKGGTKYIKIVGDFPHIYLSGNCQYFRAIASWGIIVYKSFGSSFRGCSHITFQDGISPPNLTQVTDMSSMFTHSSFNSKLNDWDVSHVTNMASMFQNAESFNQPLDNWKVGNVTNMQSMFGSAREFNQELDGWDVRKVTNMSMMFNGTNKFNKSINTWDVSNVQTMFFMFSSARKFNKPLDGWNQKVSNVTNMRGMFGNAYDFNQDLSNWNVKNVTNYSGFSTNSSLSAAHTPNFP